MKYYNASILSSIGSGLSSLGGMFMSNAGTINSVGGQPYGITPGQSNPYLTTKSGVS